MFWWKPKVFEMRKTEKTVLTQCFPEIFKNFWVDVKCQQFKIILFHIWIPSNVSKMSLSNWLTMCFCILVNVNKSIADINEVSELQFTSATRPDSATYTIARWNTKINTISRFSLLVICCFGLSDHMSSALSD